MWIWVPKASLRWINAAPECRPYKSEVCWEIWDLMSCGFLQVNFLDGCFRIAEKPGASGSGFLTQGWVQSLLYYRNHDRYSWCLGETATPKVVRAHGAFRVCRQRDDPHPGACRGTDGLDLIGFNGFRVEDWIPVSEILLVCCSSNSFSKLQKHSM